MMTPDRRQSESNSWQRYAGAGPEGMASARFTKTADRGDCGLADHMTGNDGNRKKVGDAGNFS